MRAVEIDRSGGPEVLSWRHVPEPTPGPGEVLIDVVAAGVNRADLLQRQGVYPPPAGASSLLGLECAGRVAALGEPEPDGGPLNWQIGDEVCALLPGGGYAERVAVHQSLLLPAPDGVPLVDAAVFPEAAATVSSNLFAEPLLKPGESLLVHGGAGGLGVYAIQAARVYSAAADVLTTARAAHREALRDLGADVVVDYRDEDFAAEVDAHTKGRGVDVVLDNMGAAYLERNLSVLARDGRLAIIGMQGGRKAELDIAKLLSRRVRLSAAGLRARPLRQRADIMATVAGWQWSAVSQGRIRPVVAARVPMAEAAEAHRMLESGGHLGKVLLTR